MHLEDLTHYLFYDGAKADIAINYTMLLVSTTVSWSKKILLFGQFFAYLRILCESSWLHVVDIVTSRINSTTIQS